MSMTRLRIGASLAGAALLFGAGCAELDVTNPNNPTRAEVFARPTDVENLIGSTYLGWWQAVKLDFPNPALSVLAGHHTASWGNFAMFDVGRIPREAISNSTAYTYAGLTQIPWTRSYGAANSLYNALQALDGTGRPTPMVIEGDANRTRRARAFAKFVQGLVHANVATLYDRGFILDETQALPLSGAELKPAAEVGAFAIRALEQCVELSAQPFNAPTPTDWINGVTLTNDQLRRLCASYIVRYIPAMARSPQERRNADWAKVMQYSAPEFRIQADFAPIGDGNFWWEREKSHMYFPGSWGRTSYYTVGPADTTGAFQAWHAAGANATQFQIRTPDRRVTAEGNPQGQGTDFRFHATCPFNAARGLFFCSHYSHHPFDYFADFTGPMTELPVREVLLTRAEGHFYRNELQQAAEIVNQTRVARGSLAAATTQGAPGPATSCVPQRRTERGCGDLLEAIKYERRIELYARCGPRYFTDARGWGELLPGSPLHLPIPERELLVLGLPVYTFGGQPGQPGSAP
jgi:starch-binding outer membrane protein, SusD/RagB family